MLKYQSLPVTMVLVWWICAVEGFQQCPTTGCSCLQYTCCLSVVENSDPGTTIGIASSNVDFINQQNTTNIQYTITSDSSNQFTVDIDSGVIATAVEFDREAIEDNCVSFGIRVTNSDDGSLVATLLFAAEILDVNDNPPQFSRSNFTISIDETTTDRPFLSCPGGPQEILAASDPDSEENGTVSYSIAVGHGDDSFRVPNPSNPCVVNNVDLDRDTPPISYSLVLIARDNGTPSLNSSTTVTFTLNDINDNPPMFNSSEITITVPENAEPQTVIYRFAARDIDEAGSVNIEYSLSLSQDQDIPFEINRTTGELKLTEPLDAELRPEYTVTVSATDTDAEDLTGSASVTIQVEDINEKKDVTIKGGQEEPTLIEEEISTEIIIVIVVEDIERTPANQNNSVVILSGAEFFQVQKTTFGTSFNFFISQSTPIDRERNASIDLVIQVIQGGNPTFIENHTFPYTIIDKNDNAPYMPQPSYPYEENKNGPDDVLNICDEAMDDDIGENGQVISFELISVVNGRGDILTPNFTRAMMARNDQSDSNCVLYAPPIDRETNGDILTINVVLIDGGTPPMNSTQSFVVDIGDINDNFPRFSQTLYQFNVSENVPNAVVGFVEALDLDDSSNGKVSYFLRPDPAAPFSINSSTGEIKANNTLDREEERMFTIYVNASDNGNPPMYSEMLAEVHITITDQNDNIPVFAGPSITMSIKSNMNVGETVVTVMANDLDSPPNDQIFYRLENFSEYFNVSMSSGEVKVSQQLPNEEATYYLLISAYNQEFFDQRSTINVTITVFESQKLSIALVGGVAGCALFLVILIIVVAAVLVGIVYHRRHLHEHTVDDHVYDQIDEAILNSSQSHAIQLSTNMAYSRSVKPPPRNYQVPQQRNSNGTQTTTLNSLQRETTV